MSYQLYYPFPGFGLLVTYTDEVLLKAIFVAKTYNHVEYNHHCSELSQKIVQQLDEYAKNGSFQFDLPLKVEGSEFGKKVWAVMCSIPAGKVMSYKQVAEQISTAPRAVGSVCGRNPFSIFIPCHRIVSSSGLGGFNLGKRSDDLDIKKWLLNHEGLKY